MRKIAVYGKGGIGKSVVATGISACLAQRGTKVIHIGCDPKSDSGLRLMENGKRPRTVLDILKDEIGVPDVEIVHRGKFGIDVCEAGGPPAGLGCGGRGVARAIEYFDDTDLLNSRGYDVAVFDVLGDVVCGGFAAPLRKGFGEIVIIVISEEPMAMYAANNIVHALLVYRRNGVILGGLVGNLKNSSPENRKMIEDFASRLSTKIIGWIPRDDNVQKAERKRMTVTEYNSKAPSSLALLEITEKIHNIDSASVPVPTPMQAEDFFDYMENLQEND